MERRNEGDELLPTLPLEEGMFPMRLRLYRGVWIPEYFVAGIISVHWHFQARPTDVLLVSYPKSGTTWLKALAFAVMNRDRHPAAAAESHPFRSLSPHRCLPFLEAEGLTLERLSKLDDDDSTERRRHRLIATHLPVPLPPDSVEAIGCRMVCVCRDPKDVAVSRWYFLKKLRIEGVTMAARAEDAAVPLEKFIDMFCDGVCPYGPIWEHGYWNESQRAPEKVLFLRYEEMLEESKTQHSMYV